MILIHRLLPTVLVPILALSALAPAQRPQTRPAAGSEAKPEAQAPKDEVTEIEKLIADGLAAWRAKDEVKASDLLQKAIAKIQARAARALSAFLPKAAQGWTFDEPSVDSGSWGTGENAMQWSNAQVTAHKGEDTQTHVQITNSPQIYDAMQTMVQVQVQMKELLRQQGKDVDVKSKNGFQVVSMVDDGTGTAWMVGKRILVTFNVDHCDRKTLDEVLGWIDTAGLAKLDGQ
ncbi:MAG: hypothetical protein U1F36_12810 [Planctomycetota bacterium]